MLVMRALHVLLIAFAIIGGLALIIAIVGVFIARAQRRGWNPFM